MSLITNAFSITVKAGANKKQNKKNVEARFKRINRPKSSSIVIGLMPGNSQQCSGSREQRSVDSEQCSVNSEQCSVNSEQRSGNSQQCSVNREQHTFPMIMP